MKRSLLIAAAAALATSGAYAQSSVSLYGLVDMSYGKSLFSDLTDQKADLHSGGDNGSSEGNSTTRVGIKGSIDAGSGYKANFRFETGGITSNGDVNPGGNFFNRQAWAGVSGGFGEVRVGRQDSVAFQTMIDFDFNGASNGVSAGGYTAAAPWLPGRRSREIQYISPSFSGITAQFGLRPKGNSQDGNKDAFSGSLKYAGGPIAAAVAFQSKFDSSTKDFVSVAGSYDFGVAKVMASYADGGKFASGGSGKGFMIGATAPVAGANIGFHYAQNQDSDLGKPKSFELFANKEVLKNLIVYAELGDWKADSATVPAVWPKDKAKGYAVGAIYVF